MGSQLGVPGRTKPPKALGMIGLNLELPGQLAIDRLDNLAHVIVTLPHHSWELGLLIRAR
jgi:hypothetical protein